MHKVASVPLIPKFAFEWASRAVRTSESGHQPSIFLITATLQGFLGAGESAVPAAIGLRARSESEWTSGVAGGRGAWGGGPIMSRGIAVVACGFTFAACFVSLPGRGFL